MYIWWTSQTDYAVLGEVALELLEAPQYLQSEYRSRLGRAGRGRLWSAPQFDVKSIDWDEAKAMSLKLEDCGGIIIEDAELELCLKLPGLVTDMNMNRIVN